MKVCIIGQGYIGLPTAIIAAKHGVEVFGVDINEAVVEQFLAANPDFKLEPFDLPGIGRVEDGMLTLWPHVHGTDGFFMAKFVRNT